MRSIVRLLMCLALLGWSCSAYAQAGPGALAGRLIDQNGILVTGLNTPIQMKNVTTGEVFTAKVEPTGEYSITNLAAGRYDLSVPIECCMYRTYEQKAVEIAAGQTLKLDLKLNWGINLGTIGDDPGMLSNDLRAQTKNTTAKAPRTRNGKPDLSGIWYDVPRVGQGQQIKMKPWALEIQAKLRKMNQGEGDGPAAQGPAAYCLPQNATPTLLPFPYQFVQTPTEIVQLTEFLTPGHRIIYMDGRPHPKLDDLIPGWFGHSIGKWDGDTLVIDTVGFNEVTPGYAIHSEKLHVVERIRRIDRGHLTIDVTADDAEAWDAPYHTTYEAGLVEGTEILEWVCAENNKDATHFGGLGWRGRP